MNQLGSGISLRPLRNLLKRVLPESFVLHAQALDHYLDGEPEIRLLGQLCDKRRNAVDVGANIGIYSYFLRRKARRVQAYEPHPVLAARLQRVLSGVTVRPVAVSDAAGRVFLQVPVDGQGQRRHELSSIAQQFDGRCERFEVDRVTIDGERLDDVGFLKVDVEQHEREVLRGALATIRRCRPVIMTECTPLLYTQPLDREFGFILELGYAGFFRMDSEWLPLERLDPSVHANPERFGSRAFMGNNIVFFPREHALSGRGPRV